MTTSILVADRITKRFSGHTAVDGLSLTVPPGVIYGLLGPNGAGKSTTIRMIMGIYVPDEGSVSVFGGSGGLEQSERIGYLPEERGLYPKMRVLDVLLFLAEMKGIDRRSARTRALTWLERLRLSRWRMRKGDELSKGVPPKGQFLSPHPPHPDLPVMAGAVSGPRP